MLFVKRLLRFPAYRCDPCRERFFSIKPFRKILPSMAPASEHKEHKEVVAVGSGR
jgi:hypothetical protein